MPTLTLGATLTDARVSKDLSLRELARKLDLAPSYVSDVEMDKRTPSEEVLRRWAKLLALDVDRLLALAGRMPAETERYLRREPAAGALFRRLSKENLSEEQLRQLNRQIDRLTKKPKSTDG
jgi:transcriptional regulator with XRE-family HTH domain